MDISPVVHIGTWPYWGQQITETDFLRDLFPGVGVWWSLGHQTQVLGPNLHGRCQICEPWDWGMQLGLDPLAQVLLLPAQRMLGP